GRHCPPCPGPAQTAAASRPGRRRSGAPGKVAASVLTSQGGDVVGLLALLALHHVEGDLLAFLQAAEARAGDRAEMDEHVLAAVGGDEAETLGIVEPLHGAGLTLGHVTDSHLPR